MEKPIAEKGKNNFLNSGGIYYRKIYLKSAGEFFPFNMLIYPILI